MGDELLRSTLLVRSEFKDHAFILFLCVYGGDKDALQCHLIELIKGFSLKIVKAKP